MNGHRQSIPRWFRRYATIAVAMSSCLAVPRDGRNTASSEQWIARVGDRTITLEEFARRYAGFLSSTGIKDNLATREAVLDNMVNEVALLHFDRSNTKRVDKEQADAVERARRMVVLAYLKDQEIFAKIRVSEREARQAYERSHERIAARHLYARTEEEAKELSELLRIGVDFQVLAERSFTDSTLRTNGGYLGYFAWGDMDPAFEDAAYALRVGEVSPPVRTAHGFSIIKVEDRLPHPLLTEQQFLQKRSHIERVVKIRKKRSAEEEFLREVFPLDRLVFEKRAIQRVAHILLEPRQSNPEDGASALRGEVCVRTNGRAYTDVEIVLRLEALPGEQRARINSESSLHAAIRGVLLQERLLEIAHQKGYDRLAVVLTAFRQAEDALFLRQRIEEITVARSVSDSEAQEYYRKNVQACSSENELTVQEIIVRDRTLADSLRQAISQGADFASLARRFSARTWSAANGGVLGFAPVSRFGLLKDPLWNGSAGELIGPLQIEEFFGLFRILGKREGQPRPFVDVRGHVKRMVQLEEQRTTVREYLTRLQERIGVEIDQELLASFDVKEMAFVH